MYWEYDELDNRIRNIDKELSNNAYLYSADRNKIEKRLERIEKELIEIKHNTSREGLTLSDLVFFGVVGWLFYHFVWIPYIHPLL